MNPPLGISDEGGAASRPVFTLDCVGTSIACTQSGSTGTITITGGGGNSFETVAVPAGTSPVADSATDTLTITETTFLTFTGTAATDTIDVTQVTTDIGTDGLIAANAVALTTDTTGNYAAGDAEAGAALTGDTATSFFSVGTLEVGIGGSGAATFTDGGILLGSGTGAFTALGVAANGQLPIGDGTTDPVLATLTGTANEVTVTNGVGTITLDLPLNAGTDITADLEEEVTEGSLANDTILEADLKVVDAAVDEECLTFETTTGDFEWQACGSGTDTNADKEFVWPASSAWPLEPADSIPPLAKDAGTNVDMLVADFDQSTDECRTVAFLAPPDITAGGTVTFSAYWYAASVTTNNVIWDFRHNSGVAEGVDPDAADTVEASAADAVQGTAGQITVTTWTETQTNLAWVASDLVLGEFCRDANHASDNFAADARAILFAIRVPRS